MTFTWQVRCDHCGHSTTHTNELDAQRWAVTHHCPPQTPDHTGRVQHNPTQPKKEHDHDR